MGTKMGKTLFFWDKLLVFRVRSFVQCVEGCNLLEPDQQHGDRPTAVPYTTSTSVSECAEASAVVCQFHVIMLQACRLVQDLRLQFGFLGLGTGIIEPAREARKLDH